MEPQFQAQVMETYTDLRKMINELTFRIWYNGVAFGDNLMSAYMVSLLNGNGYRAFLDNTLIENLVDVPLWRDRQLTISSDVFHFNCVRRNRPGKETNKKLTIYEDLMIELKRTSGITFGQMWFPKSISVRLDNVKASRPPADVVLVTETGYWTPYRNWPYFKELKEMLKEAGISFIDASAEGIRDQELLRIVKDSKLYLGLETGASHYVSKFANGKTLIIQSGYCDFDYWAGQYQYQEIRKHCDKSPCWLREACPYDAACMKSITFDEVFEQVQLRLEAG